MTSYNAHLGPNYWCKSAYKDGQVATFDDFDEFLDEHCREINDDYDVSYLVSEAYEGILDVTEADFSHNGLLDHINDLVDIEKSHFEKKHITDYAKQIMEATNVKNEDDDDDEEDDQDDDEDDDEEDDQDDDEEDDEEDDDNDDDDVKARKRARLEYS